MNLSTKSNLKVAEHFQAAFDEAIRRGLITGSYTYVGKCMGNQAVRNAIKPRPAKSN